MWPALGRAQAALFMEEPYGFFGTINPTGHDAIYLARICADTPVKLRRCMPGETGSVISRYQGIDGYDWVAMPLIPYLYSVENARDVPGRVNRRQVLALRGRYREAHLLGLGSNLNEGNIVRGGWTQLVGVAYQRRIYAFRFETTPEQDDALMDLLNGGQNVSHFELLYNNCADFARTVLNHYFPRTFHRNLLDAGITTPKQIAHTLVRYSRKHPELRLQVMEIPKIPGNERLARSNNGVAEGFLTTGYAIPVAILNPWLAGGILADFLVQGHRRLVPKDAPVLAPDSLASLTARAPEPQNPIIVTAQTSGAAISGSIRAHPVATANSMLTESKVMHE